MDACKKRYGKMHVKKWIQADDIYNLNSHGQKCCKHMSKVRPSAMTVPIN